MGRQINFIKGFDRIALILAIVAVLPSFFWGKKFVFHEYKKIAPEYLVWKNLDSEKKNQLLKEYQALSVDSRLIRIKEQHEKLVKRAQGNRVIRRDYLHPLTYKFRRRTSTLKKEITDSRKTSTLKKEITEAEKMERYPEAYQDYFVGLHLSNWRVQNPAPKKYKYPDITTCIFGGFIYSILGFLIVFFGLCGLTRSIKMILSWVIAGFKQA